MPTAKHWSLYTASLACLLANTLLVSCSPLQGHNAQYNSPAFKRVIPSSSSYLSTNNQPLKGQSYTLPPVSDVFKIVADAEPDTSKVMVPQTVSASPPPSPVSASKSSSAVLSSFSASPSDPAPPSAIILASTTAYPSNSISIHLGPGLGMTPPEATPAATNFVPISAKPAGPAADGISHKPSVAGKLIAIVVILVGLMFLIFMIFVLDYRCVCCGARKKDKSEAWKKLSSPPPESSEISEKSVTTDVSNRLLLSTLSSSLGRGVKKTDARSKALLTEKADPESKVIDISSENNYPRSKFSVSSSEYPTSLESFVRTSSSGCRHDNSPLLPAYEFCCIPSSAESLEEHHHTRTRSAPIFGHAISADRFGFLVRPGEHRRSRSISGLTYAINPREYRHSDSGSSAVSNEWKESPPDFPGGLSSAM